MLGPLKETFDGEDVILAVGLFSLVSLFFIIVLRLKKHLDKLDCIEADEMENDLVRMALVK